ncbi:MAG: transcriptional regulator [Propionibacteriaceae bacterium]|nr:transcriptional regulator [Propionibacteriaceae bacterium]
MRRADTPPNGVAPPPARSEPPELRPRQQQIVDLLASGPQATTELAAAMGLSRTAVMTHLRALESLGAVAPTTESRTAPGAKWRIAG